jgi:hypothetical protein
MHASMANSVPLIDHENQVHFDAKELKVLFGDAGHPGLGMDKDSWKAQVQAGQTDLGYWEWVHQIVSESDV